MNKKIYGVAGLGKTAQALLQAIAVGGDDVIAWEADDTMLEKAHKTFNTSLANAVDTGTVTQEDQNKILAAVTFTTDMGEFKDAGIVVEAAVEDLKLKKKIISNLSETMSQSAIIATHTSHFSVTEIAQSGKNPQRIVGLHFFQAPLGDKLVEVVRTEHSSKNAISAATEFCAKIGKETVVVKDSPGFIVNYLFVPYMNQALEAFDHNLAEKDDLDTAIRMGLGYPKGPLKLIDHIGLDDYQNLTEKLYERLKDQRFASPVILKRKVDSRKLGRHTGEGFYTY